MVDGWRWGAQRRAVHKTEMAWQTDITDRIGPLDGGTMTKIGLYSWANDWHNHKAALDQVGFDCLRTSPEGLTPARFAEMPADTMITITGANRYNFGSDQEWTDAYLTKLDSVLSVTPARTVEVWNEPNDGLDKNASAIAHQQAYGALLVAAYTHLKAKYPGTTVVAFAADDSADQAGSFIKGVLARTPGAAASFDVASIHPYVAATPPDGVKVETWGSWSITSAVQSARTQLANAGVNVPLWITEIGWQVSHADGGDFTPSSATVSPTLQAAYRARLTILAARIGVDRVYHMYPIDTDGYNGGILAGPGHLTPRPAYTALKFQQAVLTGAGPVATLKAAGDVYLYQVTTPSGPVKVAWSDTGKLQSIACTVGSRVYDMLGQLVHTMEGTSYPAKLSATPLYILPPEDAR